MPMTLQRLPDREWADRYREIRAFNPNHDDKGQFASGDGAALIPRDASGNVNPDADKYPHLAHLLNGAKVHSDGHTKKEAKDIARGLQSKGHFASIIPDSNSGNYLVTVPANAHIQASNPNHDDKGRFATGDGTGIGEHAAKVADAHKAYQAAKDAYFATRRDAFAGAKAASQAAHEKANGHADGIHEAINQISVPESGPFAKAFAKVDEANAAFDPAMTHGEKHAFFSTVETAAQKAAESLGKKNDLTPEQISENADALKKIASEAKSGREAIHLSVHKLREAKSIRDGRDHITASAEELHLPDESEDWTDRYLAAKKFQDFAH